MVLLNINIGLSMFAASCMIGIPSIVFMFICIVLGMVWSSIALFSAFVLCVAGVLAAVAVGDNHRLIIDLPSTDDLL